MIGSIWDTAADPGQTRGWFLMPRIILWTIVFTDRFLLDMATF